MYTTEMLRQYSIADARKNLPTVVDEAQAGLEVQLTRRGQPVAVVMSVDQFERMKTERATFADSYRAFRQRFPEGKCNLRARTFKGLRERGVGRKVEL
jgi:prevent-host-death family protein